MVSDTPALTRRRLLATGAAGLATALAGCSSTGEESRPPTSVDSWPPDPDGGPLVTRTYYPDWMEWAERAFADATGVGVSDEGEPFAWQDRRPFDDDLVGDLRRWWADVRGRSSYDGPRRRIDVVSLQDWRLDGARDLLHPLPVERMPAWNHVRPRLRNAEFFRTDDGTYGVPVEATIAGLTYNTEVFDQPPDSWELLFDSEYTGRAVCTHQRRLPHLAAQYVGQDPRAPDDFAAIRAVLETHRDRLVAQHDGPPEAAIRRFFAADREAIRAFADGEAVLGTMGMAPMYSARFERGVPLDYTAPREGALFSAFFFGVPDEAPHPRSAALFADWALRPANAVELFARESFMPAVDVRDRVADDVADFFAWPDDWTLRYDDPRTSEETEIAYSELMREVYDLY
jgi:spermidine/putrescine-binding protein